MANQVINFHSLKLQLTQNALFLHVVDRKQDVILDGRLGLTVLAKGRPQAAPNVEQTEDKLVINWPDVSLTVHRKPSPPGTVQTEGEGGSPPDYYKYDFIWVAKKYTEAGKLQDVFSMTKAHWYGGSQIRCQEWPLEKWKRKCAPYVAGDSFKSDDYGGVQERYFLSSKGLAILVSPEIPLFLGVNEGASSELSFVAHESSPYRNPKRKPIALKYSLFQAEHARDCHQLVYRYGAIAKPIGTPNEDLFRHPIWSTWAKYKTKINQKIILDFAKEIKDNGFQPGQFEIDDDWTPSYGDWVFDPKKFPDPAKMIADLRFLGYSRITVWIHPFCSTFSKASSLPNWVGGALGGTTTWWNGLGKYLDVTSPHAVGWFRGELSALREKYGITSFKFDAGEVVWLPANYKMMYELDNPSEYATRYALVAYEADKENLCQEVRVGIRTQHLPIVVRMMDKDSNWTYDNGLKTLIPHTLTFSVIGYPFSLPDMIGGNAYKKNPEKELYIRWMGVNVFLPHLQFSLVPWQYDKEVVQIAHKMMALREKYAEKLIELAKECVRTGDPIIRPLWWIAPYDEQAQVNDSEFLVGNDLLVAPVLEKGATSRDVYFPAGTWRNELTGEELTGGKSYSGILAALDEVPHFTLLTPIPGLTPTAPIEDEEPAPDSMPPEDSTEDHEAPEGDTDAHSAGDGGEPDHTPPVDATGDEGTDGDPPPEGAADGDDAPPVDATGDGGGEEESSVDVGAAAPPDEEPGDDQPVDETTESQGDEPDEQASDEPAPEGEEETEAPTEDQGDDPPPEATGDGAAPDDQIVPEDELPTEAEVVAEVEKAQQSGFLAGNMTPDMKKELDEFMAKASKE